MLLVRVLLYDINLHAMDKKFQSIQSCLLKYYSIRLTYVEEVKIFDPFKIVSNYYLMMLTYLYESGQKL